MDVQVWRDLAIEHRVDLFSAGAGFEGAAKPRDEQPDRLGLGGRQASEVRRVPPSNEHKVAEITTSLLVPVVGIDQFVIIDRATATTGGVWLC